MCEYKRGLLTSWLGAREVNELGQLASLGDRVVLVWTRTFGHLHRGSVPGSPGLSTGFNGTERASWRLSVRNSANAVRPSLSGPSCAPA